MNPDQSRRLVPQFVQLIVVPLDEGKDMDNNTTVIEEEPSGVAIAFLVVRHHVLFFQSLYDFIADGVNLAL